MYDMMLEMLESLVDDRCWKNNQICVFGVSYLLYFIIILNIILIRFLSGKILRTFSVGTSREYRSSFQVVTKQWEKKLQIKWKMIAEKNLKIYSALYFLYESESDVFYVGFEIIDMAFPYFILAIMVLCIYLHHVYE